MKTIVIGSILTAWLCFWYFSPPSDKTAKVPKLPETYWGPDSPRADPEEIRPFKIDIPTNVIDDLNERLDRTRFSAPPLENVKWNYGTPSTRMKVVADYWRNKYNWSLRQDLLNKYPQFTTTIQGLDIHFYHVKPNLPEGKKLRVLPLLILHGWPGSVVEFQKIIPYLIEPKKDRDFVFELVVPSLPGYGFSKPAVRPGLGPAQVAVVMKNLMVRLGHKEFYTQGGDWGSIITSTMASLFPYNVLASHYNWCISMNTKTLFWTVLGNWLPYLVVRNEYYNRMYPLSEKWGGTLMETGYLHIQATKPDTVGVGLSDSPIGLAAYLLEKFSTGTNPAYRDREDGGLLEKFTMDELLDNVMIYWVTNSITTSMRIYAEHFNKTNMESRISKLPILNPTGCAAFPNEISYQPKSLLRNRYQDIIHMTHPPVGGHFAALEQPELLSVDIWNFFNLIKKNPNL